MQTDDPPYLSVGTAVSAKYKGAFCEAKVSKVVRLVKCKVTYKMGLGSATLTDEQIKGTLRVGQLVQAKHPDRKELVEATITKIQDCSQYTVVFDDGDITTLRRTALCLKSGRHFNESETLDQLPLTHPEHFGNPVVGGRRGRRNRQLKEDSSDGEAEEENEPDLEAYLLDLKRVVSVETTEKKRSKDNWFPGLVVIPSAQPTVRINMKDEYLIRSFKDGRYYTVPKKEVTEFNREMAEKIDTGVLSEAIQKAIRFLDHNELPPHWEKSSLFHSHNVDSESEENYSDSSDDEPSEEKDRFVAQLYKFMDEAGTPLNKTPAIANQDIDLHRLFRIVQKMGGYNRVTNQNKWRSVALRLHLTGNQNIFNQVKAVYKKCLSSYETFYRTLGVTMLNHTGTAKKNKGRSLIRDRDRNTPISSPAPASEKDEFFPEEKKDVVAKEASQEPAVKSKRIEKKRALASASAEVSDTNSSDTTEQSEVSKDTPRPKREKVENKVIKEKEKEKKSKIVSEKVKNLAEKFEEQSRKEEEEKVQNTRSKTQSKQKETPQTSSEKKIEPPKSSKDIKTIPLKNSKKPISSILTKEEEKKGKKRLADEKPPILEAPPEKQPSTVPNINVGDKLKVYYGSSNESKVTYEAKVIEIDNDQSGPVYLVHYAGWNARYDEWIHPQRIAENLSATKKAKRSKQPSGSSSSSKNSPSKPMAKRPRLTSVSARSSTTEIPRSTTPSSVTSSGSRTKSPATPATRSAARLRQDSSRRLRRISAQTDASMHSDSESEGTGSDSEVSRTRSRSKSENEPETKTYNRRPPRASTLSKLDKRKDREGGPSKEDYERTRSRRMKKMSDKSADDSEDDGNPPKGRDFDLNQIRSELKGISKAIKIPALGSVDDKEDITSSDESSNPPPLEKSTHSADEPAEKKEKLLEKSSSSEDVYEFKEPEPFEFENRPKLGDEKKRLVPRIFDDVDKSLKMKKLSVPLRKQDNVDSDDEDDEETLPLSPAKDDEDPFDKLVESPSFNLVKTIDKNVEKKEKVVRNICEETLSLFRDLPADASDDYSGDMELSDCESSSQIFTTSPEKLARAKPFSDNNFLKTTPESSSLDMEFSSLGKTAEGKTKDSDDDDAIKEQILTFIAQSSSTDDDSSDVLAVKPSNLLKKRDDPIPTMSGILGINVCESAFNKEIQEMLKIDGANEEVKPSSSSSDVEKSASSDKQQISPALQETDSTLLESIVSQPPVSLDVKLEETAKELSSIKTGTRIADSILQKFNSIKKENTTKASPKREIEDKETIKAEAKSENVTLKKEEAKEESKSKDEKQSPDETKIEHKSEEDDEEDEDEIPSPPIEEPVKKLSAAPKLDLLESKKRKKVLSRAYIEESETDSSDSEQLVIARSDEDSQATSLDNKPDAKESDSSNVFNQSQTTDDSQSQEERNFDFKEDENRITQPSTKNEATKSDSKPAEETSKEEDPDPHLHSLLLCEEEIPRSPAPANDPPPVQETVMKSVLEMPFASAPSTSNSKGLMLEQKKLTAPANAESQQVAARERRSQNSTVLDNTPPTTPESSISNLSPRGDTGGLSPTLGDNESGKSNDVESEYPRQRSAKVSPYSEEDTQMLSEMKKPASCKKRRKSLRNSEDTMPLPSKKTKKTRSRHNSDSDDTSEYSNAESTAIPYNISSRSPRPSKYNFYVEFDPNLDSGQRIAVLQQKLTELRKTYADVKAELASVERRRKKIRRREREALKAAKQEITCA